MMYIKLPEPTVKMLGILCKITGCSADVVINGLIVNGYKFLSYFIKFDEV